MTAAETTLVQRIDHVVVPLADAERAYTYLTETLGLPGAWPYAPYPGFASGGVVVGNANLEVLQSNTAMPAMTHRHPSRVQGIAFEPAAIDDRFLSELDRRLISHSAPIQVGDQSTGWTTVFVDGFVDEQTSVFFCQYHHPAARDHRGRAGDHRARRGGVLGVEATEEVVVGSSDPNAAIQLWQRLLAPCMQDEPGTWRLDAGPRLRIVPAEMNGVVRLIWRVTSFEHAERALARIDARGPESALGLSLSTPPLEGLEVILQGAQTVAQRLAAPPALR